MDRRTTKRLRYQALPFLMTFLLAATASGQVQESHVTLGPSLGSTSWSKDMNLNNEWFYGGHLGLWPYGSLGFEGHYARMWSQTLHGGQFWTGATADGAVDQNLDLYGGDVIVSIAPRASFSPFFLAGWQEAHYHENSVFPREAWLNGPQLGAGLLFWPLPRLVVRAEARDWMWDFKSPPVPDPPGDKWTHNLAFSVALEVALGGLLPSTDGDHDGVVDGVDRCPDTPREVRVDFSGCPIDRDGDGIPDGLDLCASTPRCAIVNARGCPSDADGDAVLDGIDICAGTRAGVHVDAKGCPTDADGDGAFDGVDDCPNTQAGATVDSRGCPDDSDRDGVLDGLDKCPDTPSSARVDAEGCPILVSEKETELLNTGQITVRDINFDTGKWTIRPESFAILEEIGHILVQWPDLRVEIGGHTDARGSALMNLALSEKRANAVRGHLLSRFPEIRQEQYTAAGYGEARPIADNETVTGMAMNRRVEFKVLNTEVLKKEHQSRRMLRK